MYKMWSHNWSTLVGQNSLKKGFLMPDTEKCDIYRDSLVQYIPNAWQYLQRG